MLLAQPVSPQLGYLVQTPDGRAGAVQTMRTMREMVNAAKVNPQIIAAAQSLVSALPPHDFDAEARTLFDYVAKRIRYVRDVANVETLTTPEYVLSRKCGDCDDKVMLLAALLESIGALTRFVIAGYSDNQNFEHVYLQVLIDNEWKTLDPSVNGAAFGWEPPGALVLCVERV